MHPDPHKSVATVPQRTWVRRLALGAALALEVACARPGPRLEVTTAEVTNAIDRQDFDRLVSMSKGQGPQAELCAAIVSAMLGQNGDAAAGLERIAGGGGDPALAVRATLALSGVRVNQGRYGDAARLMTEVERLGPSVGVTMSPQSRDFFLALSALPPMRADVAGAVAVPVERDQANLPRVAFAVHEESDKGVFDTGAAYSTATASTAARLGLRFLGVEAGVSGSTGAVVRSGLAVADSLKIGGATFYDVPFIVVPDEALTFAQAGYAISSILGFPVISQMGRVELMKHEGGETLRFAPSVLRPDPAKANVFLSGWQPVALLGIAEGNGRYRFFLDTGARGSTLFEPALAGGSFGKLRKGSISEGGAGGQIVRRDTQVVPRVTLRLGAATTVLADMNVAPADGSGRDGVLGQEVLSRFSTLVLDFGSMTLAVT